MRVHDDDATFGGFGPFQPDFQQLLGLELHRTIDGQHEVVAVDGWCIDITITDRQRDFAHIRHCLEHTGTSGQAIVL